MKKYIFNIGLVLVSLAAILPVRASAVVPTGDCYFDPAKHDSYFIQTLIGGNEKILDSMQHPVVINYAGTDSYYATKEAAEQMARCLGDSIVSGGGSTPGSVFYIPPRWEIVLSNGLTVPAGMLIREYFYYNGNTDLNIWATLEFCATIAEGGCGSGAPSYYGIAAPEFYRLLGLPVPPKVSQPTTNPNTNPTTPTTPSTQVTSNPNNDQNALLRSYVGLITRLIDYYRSLLANMGTR